ncbi:MAG: glycoside hydrolase family 97 N-terminal domain-containing protein, partial [Candidatus Cryptobacteroides sp.]
MRRITLVILTLLTALTLSAKDRSYKVVSPSGKIEAQVNVGSGVNYGVCLDGRTIIEPSPVSMTLSDGRVWGRDPKILKVARSSNDTSLEAPLYKASKVRDNYNCLTISFKGGWSLEFRVYEDAVAYRFATTLTKPFEISGEQVSYNFPQDWTVTLPYVKKGTDGDFRSQYFNSFENLYTVAPISGLNARRLAFMPLLVDAGEGVKVCITDVNLKDYPGMYLHRGASGNSLEAEFAPCPKTVVDGGYNNIQGKVTEYEDFLVAVDSPRAFPWRVAVIGTDIQIAQSDAGWLLAEPS